MTLYQLSSTGAIKAWTIEQYGNQLLTSWGQLGGKTQTTTDTVEAVNLGKSNFIPANEQATLEMNRRIKKKRDDGYTEDLQSLKDKRTFKLSTIGTNFAPAKPVENIDKDEVIKLAAENKVIIQRKVDGQRHLIVKDETGKVRIFSRKMIDFSEHLPHLVDQAKALPNGTVLDVELTIWDKDDHFKSVSAILRSKPERAINLQKDKPLTAYVFDVLYYKNEPVWHLTYAERYDLLKTILRGYLSPRKSNFILAGNLLNLFSVEEIVNWKLSNKWEGYCIWRTDQSSKVRFDGKPSRVNCYKFKRDFTEDCIARGYYEGKRGKNQGRFGGFEIYQYHFGKEIYVGRCGGGFTDRQRDLFMRLKYPFVVEVKFAERLRSMKLRYPVFLRIREDKPIKECTVSHLPREE